MKRFSATQLFFYGLFLYKENRLCEPDNTYKGSDVLPSSSSSFVIHLTVLPHIHFRMTLNWTTCNYLLRSLLFSVLYKETYKAVHV